MRCCQLRRSSINAQYSRPSVRTSITCAGGIHDSGNRPSNNRVRSSRASERSVLARFFGPRKAATSAGSPICTLAPAASSSSLTYRHPVQPSSPNSPLPSGQCLTSQSRNLVRVAGRICPQCTSPSSSTQSNVICCRCTSKPPIIVISGASSSSRNQFLTPSIIERLSRGGPQHMSSLSDKSPTRLSLLLRAGQILYRLGSEMDGADVTAAVQDTGGVRDYTS